MRAHLVQKRYLVNLTVMSKVRRLDNLHAGISDLSELPKKKTYCSGTLSHKKQEKKGIDENRQDYDSIIKNVGHIC